MKYVVIAACTAFAVTLVQPASASTALKGAKTNGVGNVELVQKKKCKFGWGTRKRDGRRVFRRCNS